MRAPRLPGFVQFSLPLGAGDVLNAVLQRADIILLTVFVGTSAAGVYAAAEFITRVIASARSVFDSVAAPVFSEAVNLGQRDRLKQNLMMMNRWVVSVAAPIALTVVVLRRDLLALYGPGFQEGAAAVWPSWRPATWSTSASGWWGGSWCGGGSSRSLLINNVGGRRRQHHARVDSDSPLRPGGHGGGGAGERGGHQRAGRPRGLARLSRLSRSTGPT